MASSSAVTIPAARISPLSAQEQAATGYNYKFKLLYSDLAAGTSADEVCTITLGATPAKWYIDKAGFNIKTAFLGITAMTVTVGTTSSVAALMSSTSILTAAFLNQVSTVPVLTNATATAAVNLVAVFTAAGTGGNSGLTAGVLEGFLHMVDTAKLP